MSLATVDDLELYLGATFSTGDADRAQLLLDLATGAIQRFTRQTIELVEDDEVVLIGNGTKDLVLPQIPVVDVTEVVVEGDTLTEDDEWIFDGHRTIWRSASWGHVRVTVTYSHGWADIPGDIRGICLQAASRAWRNPAGASQESVGQYSITYGAGVQGVGLSPDEKAILGDLRRKWMATL